ncbi:RNA-binding ATPase activator esf2 [Imshaugia aleurites]|uniref:18S rRNA factor 2 n=1 Tax=Imshaugia aleurites TaxID=172621 RepID=A0A8H3EYL4_9LECA|nr:RNA-binding ATPase activator esf2 [Imshaugia aleurites]
MAVRKHNEFLDTNFSEDDEDLSSGSEAAADSRTAGLASHRSKRHKLTIEHSESDEETDHDTQDDVAYNNSPTTAAEPPRHSTPPTTDPAATTSTHVPEKRKPLSATTIAATNQRAHKAGVVYLSRIPPFMRPSTVRTLLSTHGAITRLFLTPEAPSTYLSRRRAGGNRKHSYIDGWVEFGRKRDARVCVAAINGRIVGGKKGGWYRDDVWNARYLKGFAWGDLMAGVRGEEREREERVRVGLGREGRERMEFLRNLERGRVEGTRRVKRERRAEREVGGEMGAGEENGKGQEKAETGAFERRFRQNEVRGGEQKGVEQSDETRRVLSRIF